MPLSEKFLICYTIKNKYLYFYEVAKKNYFRLLMAAFGINLIRVANAHACNFEDFLTEDNRK